MCPNYTLILLDLLIKIYKTLATKKAGGTPPAEKKGVTPKKVANKVINKDVSEPPPTEKTTQKSNPTLKKAAEVAIPIQDKTIEISFNLRFSTRFGQNLYITGNHELLGNDNIENALPLSFIDNNFWGVTFAIKNPSEINKVITYNYILKNPDGTISYDWGSDKTFNPSTFYKEKTLVIDSWNYAGFYENAFYSEPFQNVLLKANHTPVKIKLPKTSTHTFRVKAPLLEKGQTLCIVGSGKGLGNWNPDDTVLLSRNQEDIYFEAKIDLIKEALPIEYKYGVYDVDAKKLIRFEDGKNRFVGGAINPDTETIINDGFAVLPSNTWKGAGVAIPVFSLRTRKSFGVGEFTDIPALVDWCKRTGLKLVQILPVNDTTATHTWLDSYPYAAISAFALHPLYLNVEKVVSSKESEEIVTGYEHERLRLNAMDAVDYEKVMDAKWAVIRKLYALQKNETFNSADYKTYFELNKHWLVSYAAFCYFRDSNKTAIFSNWHSNKTYSEQEISVLLSGDAYDEIAIHYFTQYHLHLQLKAATEYAHQKGIIVKGDIAIGISRDGADAWQHPELYHMDLQAGAPPDDFAVKGQNWGFPTYNWQTMKQDGFVWWKQRFEQMSYYFDAFRIDHILGFFRIWSIPMHAVEGIMGYFVPAIPIHINELRERGIWHDYTRFTKPFINDSVLWEKFGYDSDYVKKTFLTNNGDGTYILNEEVNTQRKVEKHLEKWNVDNFTNKVKYGLFDLISNVILFEVECSNGEQFHFRFGIDGISSFKYLDEHTRRQLDDLYVNYFFRRQDYFWRIAAMQKLPALKRVTNMLVCGEDLGLVTDCVPDVMKQLGILSLEIQRMPKDNSKVFFHPNDAPYLSVVTPSTHDMSTIRGWWEEDKSRIQKFFNHELGQWGTAPYYCEAWINKAIVLQHLYSPAMWSVFQLQDILGIDDHIRRQNPNDERINVPANPKNYWRYRMHISLEDLLNLDSFNNELSGMIKETGRG
jgi:4-alpha-glucanotransferase